jgi:glycosyltransferase involved in cell wall biosynthesis
MMDDPRANTTEGRSPQLSVLIPVYNEEKTVQQLLHRVMAAPYRKQIIVVDDGSTDGTLARLELFRNTRGVEILIHHKNRGKGAAIRTALEHARGRFTIIQDADLEYDPRDYPLLIELLERGESKVVYGSRYLGGDNELPFTKFWVGVKLLNLLIRILYGAKITDEATCYKAFETDLLRSLNLRCERFEFCPEVTAKVLKRGHMIIERPIRFSYRTVAEGKKIGWLDGFQAVWTLLRYRVLD